MSGSVTCWFCGLSVISSGIIWELMRRKRYKALKTKISRALEEGFHNYSLEVIANKAMPGRRSLEEKVEVQPDCFICF